MLPFLSCLFLRSKYDSSQTPHSNMTAETGACFSLQVFTSAIFLHYTACGSGFTIVFILQSSSAGTCFRCTETNVVSLKKGQQSPMDGVLNVALKSETPS